MGCRGGNGVHHTPYCKHVNPFPPYCKHVPQQKATVEGAAGAKEDKPQLAQMLWKCMQRFGVDQARPRPPTGGFR